MSLVDYQIARDLRLKDTPFYALVMAAVMKADHTNTLLLQSCWPEVYAETMRRYNAPGGRLPEEKLDSAPGKPKIFVFCNSCSPGWHQATALSEDGHFLAGHVCSDHGFIPHDMGVEVGGWKRDEYAKHYPDGFEVVLVEDPRTHEGVKAAHEKHLALPDPEAEQPKVVP